MTGLEQLARGFATAFAPEQLVACVAGTALGTAVGVLPGLGPVTTIALLLPFTFALSPTAAVIMLAGIYYGAQYGGSVTAILVNLPGQTFLGRHVHRRPCHGEAGARAPGAVRCRHQLICRRRAGHTAGRHRGRADVAAGGHKSKPPTTRRSCVSDW